MAGRKRMLNSDLIQQFSDLLEQGASDKRAFEALGVSSSAFYAWLQKGEAEQKRRAELDIDPDEHEIWLARGQTELSRRENPRVKAGSKTWDTEQPFAEFAAAWLDQQVYVEFVEAVTRARAIGQGVAEDCLYNALGATDVVTTVTETFTETRLRPDGTEYTYTRTINRESVTTNPGDWRAAIEYLQRRDPEHWSKTDNHNLSGGLRVELGWVDDDDSDGAFSEG